MSMLLSQSFQTLLHKSEHSSPGKPNSGDEFMKSPWTSRASNSVCSTFTDCERALTHAAEMISSLETGWTDAGRISEELTLTLKVVGGKVGVVKTGNLSGKGIGDWRSRRGLECGTKDTCWKARGRGVEGQ